MNAHRTPAEQSGFTLLEVLIAITLLALLMAMAFGSLRTAIGITRSGERTVSTTNQTRTVQEFLRRQLAQAMPTAFEVMEDTGENRVFEASRNELRYVGPMPGHLANGGPHVQWISIAGDQLLFDHSQLNGYDPDDPKANNPRDPVVLMRGFSDAWFEYRGLDENGEMGEWSRTWDNTQQLPMMVRLVVTFDESARVWPDLEIAILAGSNPASMFGFRRPHMPPGNGEAVQ